MVFVMVSQTVRITLMKVTADQEQKNHPCGVKKLQALASYVMTIVRNLAVKMRRSVTV
jgi:hypothetical protein